MPEVVSNTGPLIALAQVRQIELLRHLFGMVVLPPAVRVEAQDELTASALTGADWLVSRAPQDAFAVRLLQETLGAGESEAIVLAQEVSADWLLLDDLAARRKAEAVGLRVVGTLGPLLMGKLAGHIPAVKPVLDELRQAHFHMSAELSALVLQQAHEAE